VSAPVALAIAGCGKIARDQHAPAIRGNAAFSLQATASPEGSLDGVPAYQGIGQMFDACPKIAAVAVCTTPQVRYAVARQALERGCHVLLEKPPAATLGEASELVALAARQGVSLLASWHSRHANGVEPARVWLSRRRIARVTVTWHEDVRVWHPGQTWIWKAGGLGVFDPGINALSIVTHIVPGNLLLREALLSFPSNCECPIAAIVDFSNAAGAALHVDLNFRHTGTERWDIDIETDDGRLSLSKGGRLLHINGQPVAVPQATEYSRLYAHFAELIAARRSDADLSPLTVVADAFLSGRRVAVEPFNC
jgi:D-galactose 1-dehydrogenase